MLHRNGFGSGCIRNRKAITDGPWTEVAGNTKPHLGPFCYMPRTKYYVFTLNNYTEEEAAALANYAQALENSESNPKCTYCVVGKEVGESGTRHLQGYIEFSTRCRLTQVKRVPGLSRAHFEGRRGSAREAADYCIKDGDLLVEAGTISDVRPGQRTDLEALKEDLKNGKRARDLADDHFKEFLRYQRGINAARIAYAPKRDWQCSVIVYWGRTGAGKTRAVFDNVLTTEDIYVHPGGQWFDGYEGQPIVLFDDYAGSEFKLQYFLKLLDRYPMHVPIKGGFASFVPYEIYITSNMDPRDWYRNAHNEHVEAMFRRFTNVVQFH